MYSCHGHGATYQAVRTAAALRRQRTARKLHALGARAIAELLAEFPDAEARAAEYIVRLTPAMLAVTGGDRFPPPPLHLVDAA